MNEIAILELIQQTCFMILKISAPVLIISFIVGLVISLLQALTQIQEATISFVPKLAAILVTFSLAFPYMLQNLMEFTQFLFDKIKVS